MRGRTRLYRGRLTSFDSISSIMLRFSRGFLRPAIVSRLAKYIVGDARTITISISPRFLMRGGRYDTYSSLHARLGRPSPPLSAAAHDGRRMLTDDVLTI